MKTRNRGEERRNGRMVAKFRYFMEKKIPREFGKEIDREGEIK
jgi:hypothetical protein